MKNKELYWLLNKRKDLECMRELNLREGEEIVYEIIRIDNRLKVGCHSGVV